MNPRDEKHDSYDRENERPVLRGNSGMEKQVAGFKNVNTGEFRAVMSVHNGMDIDKFIDIYDLTSISKE